MTGLASLIDNFSCSMQALDADRYHALMRGPRFEDVMTALQYLAERKGDTGLQVTVTFVRDQQSEVEVQENPSLLGRAGDSIDDLFLA